MTTLSNKGEIPASGNEDKSLNANDIELHLDSEGQQKLAELVKKSVEEDIIHPESGFWAKLLSLGNPLWELFGRTPLSNFIGQVLPGWEVSNFSEYHNASSIWLRCNYFKKEKAAYFPPKEDSIFYTVETVGLA